MNESATATLPLPKVTFLRRKALAEQIEARVRDRLGGWVCDFRVEVQDGGIVLSGRTRTYYAKQLVQHTAMQACGLPLLANRVEVA
jgi:hypothetical protein